MIDVHSNVITAWVIVQETDADRAYILEFHNGEQYFSGRGQQKLSCTYESVNDGISVECQNLQNIRISNFHGLMNSISRQETFLCPDIEEYKGDLTFKSLLQSKGVQSMFARPIKTLNGKIIGILCLSGEKRKWGDDSEQFARKQARVISGYLI